jgi:hypothetical protein
MASFTDAIPQFNPYIQQLPVEALVSVGMQKQQQYDQGLQRIQSEIDRVAGLDIVRDVDRQYLQSKLNDLGSKLRTVAAGDFSNFQLVNSVAGMAGKVAKDNNIISAVQSTAKYRKGIQDMDTAIKDGKSSASNEWLFGYDANEWLNSSDLNKQFNSRFYQYSNYKKNAVEAIKGLTKSKTLTEDAFSIDEKGNMVIADAITRMELSGIPPEQIQQALMATLSPDDFRQMQTDGRYNYSNVSNEEFVNSINGTYQTNLNKFEEKKKFLEASVPTTNNVQAKEAIKQQIADIDKYLVKMKSDYDDVSKTFATGDIESAKARLHTRGFIDQFSNAFSFTEISKTYETSPYAEAARWRENLAWDKTKYANEQKWKALDYDIKVKEYQLKEKEFLTKQKSNQPIVRTVDGAIDQSELPNIDMTKLENDINSRSQSLKNSDREFLKRINGKDATESDLTSLGQQYEQWLKRPNSIDPEIREHFEVTSLERESLKSDITVMSDIDKQLMEEFPALKMPIPSTVKSAVISVPQGEKVVTGRDMANFALKYGKFIHDYVDSSGRPQKIYKIDDAKKELTNEEFEMFNIVRKSNLSMGLSNQENEFMKSFKIIKDVVLTEYGDALRKSNVRSSELLKERYTTTSGISRGIPLGTAELKDEFRGLLGAIDRIAQRNNGELANSPDFNRENLLKIMGSSNMSATITSTEKTQYQEPKHIVTVIGDGLSTSFEISESQKQSMFPGEYQANPLIQFATPYIDQVRKMGGVSTSLDGKYVSSHNNAFLKAKDFPGVKIYGVTGDLASLSQSGDPLSKNYTLKINVYDPSKKQWVENINALNGSIPVENLYETMMSLTDIQIFQLLNNGRTPTQEELSKLKENSKVPY